MSIKNLALIIFCIIICIYTCKAQSNENLCNPSSRFSVFLRSSEAYNGASQWKIKKFSDTKEDGSIISKINYNTKDWYPAIVPGTVLNSLVFNKVYPETYYGDNNRKIKNLIPDIADVGREFYHYWFRTEFEIPRNFEGKHVWLKFHGINYRCEIWVNGKYIGKMAGMFNTEKFEITTIADFKNKNAVAVSVLPVDFPGTTKLKDTRSGAAGENHNGGDGEIGRNVTMLMSVGWDFSANDGIRDRNTGIWRDVELYATGDVVLENPFVKTKLPLPDTTSSQQTISVDVKNVTSIVQTGVIKGYISENKVHFEKPVSLKPNEKRAVVFTPDEFKQLQFKNPRLWWPVNKGNQNLYNLELEFVTAQNIVSHKISTRFGVREITSDQNTPDSSRRFLVNGHPIFIRGTNWVPEAMLRNSEMRTYTELRYTYQAGVNLIRLWGGGVTESDYFFQLCDEYGILVWAEFWITGDTDFPVDTALYLQNLESTVKRIRNHPSLAYYVASNESDEIPGTRKLLYKIDGTRGYQPQSECDGVHDGSPYKYENPMQYFENTASKRGSRVDGFNPEYGTPCIPVFESLKEMMPERDLWPINDSVWNYLDGGGFHQVTTKYRQAVDQFGESSSIEEYCKKAQFVGAMNYRSIWEVWDYNKFNYGDRFASGFLFWYNNSPLPQTASRLYDWSLEPTAALYYSQNALAPLHPQFDYLKNTVSVYNDYRKAFINYSLAAVVYSFDMKPVLNIKTKINIPADGVVNDAIIINFPPSISQVHFIKLELKDANGKLVSDAFYWRSNDKYKGAWTMTGPAVSGFQEINKLPNINLTLTATAETVKGKVVIHAAVSNNTGSLSFFTQLKLKDENGKPVKPAFYTDNFFCLLPGESKTVDIEIPGEQLPGNKISLLLDGWNASEINKELTY